MNATRKTPRGLGSVLSIFLCVLVAATVVSYLLARNSSPALTPAPASAESASAALVAQASAPSVASATPQASTEIAERPASAAAAAAPTSKPPASNRVATADPSASNLPARTNSLRAWVVYAEQEIPIETGKLSLPSGARFAIKVQSSVAGQVSLHTINPSGVRSEGPVWTEPIRPNQPLVGPNLRLEGEKGLETVRVVFKPAGGGPALERRLQVWHL